MRLRQLVRQKTQPLIQRMDPRIFKQEIALIDESRNRIGDCVAQAAVERAKFVDREERIAFECQIGYRLTQVAVVVDHLVDREATLQEARARAALRWRRSRTE